MSWPARNPTLARAAIRTYLGGRLVKGVLSQYPLAVGMALGNQYVGQKMHNLGYNPNLERKKAFAPKRKRDKNGKIIPMIKKPTRGRPRGNNKKDFRSKDSKKKSKVISNKKKKQKMTNKSRRVNRPTDGFPKSRLVKIKSTHMVDLNPGSSSTVASIIVNPNNPLDPFDQTNSALETLVSAEHHPKYWNIYETIYDKYQPISCKVTVRALTGSGNTSAFAMSLIACSQENFSECSAIAHTSRLFPVRLQEAYGKKALVQYHSSSSSTPDHLWLSKAVNIAKLEGIKDKFDIDTLQGTTSKSASESIPARAPKIILSYGSLRETQDLDTMSCVIDIEYCVLFTGLSDVEGASV